LLRGIPINLGSTQTTYAPPPSIASQVGGLGLAGLSIGKMTGAFAEGGSVDSYAGGGDISPEELDSFNDKLSDEQLQMKLATTKPGSYENLMVAGELQTRDDVRKKAMAGQGGKGSVVADLLTGGAMPPMPAQMPQQVAMLPENAGGVAALPAPNMENMEPYTAAAGGLVAFEDGGQVARFAAGGVSLTDVLRTLTMDERRFYQQTGRLPERAQAMLTGQAPMPAAPVPNPNPATVTMAADPNAPAQVPLPKEMRFYPGTAGLIQGPQTTRALPSGIEAILAQAERGEGPNVHSPGAIRTDIALPGRELPEDAGKKDLSPAAVATLAPVSMDAAMAQAKGLMGGLPTGSAFDDIKAEMKQASEERKGDLEKSAWMRFAHFGLGMAAGTSPFAMVNAGKAGVEALKGYADDLREKKKLDAEDRKILTDIKRMERADERDNVIKTAEIGTRIFSEMGANARAKLSADVQERIASQEPAALRTARAAMEDPKLAATLKDLNRPTTIDPAVKLFLEMDYAQKMQLKQTNPAQYAMLEQRAAAALLPPVVGTPDPSKIRS